MSDDGHTTRDVVGSISTDQLCGYVARVERLDVAIKALNDDKKELYAEAKVVGFDVHVLKRVIQRRRNERELVLEEDSLLEMYEGILRGRGSRIKDPLDC